MKIYTLTIGYDEDTEEIEYIQEEVTDTKPETMTYGSMTLGDWESITSEEAIELIKDVAEA